ncbi:trypsin-like serine protease [Streptomyces sp. WAC05374]|uniref:trypsin-like serine protease n=1 Tax=Streptomyces sp. WAC05374 TaxID=2487420 RepID=UPI000F878722|nr:trypsin-like serine protease [Streptomyces sp. WAC05374]RST16528.1 esterase [Streptomyces sp. WAC05374]TDF54645.1 trypsin-like serine protease [Streptomyces sp. WAC05374]TDF56281.1 trypsin-like serine protease [Streptomyces sp. WAC05374]
MHPTRRLRLAALGAALAAAPLALYAAPASAVTGGTASTDTTHAYTAQLTVGPHDRGCSAVLVDAEWLLTAASCFADDPAVSLAVPAGAPKVKTTAIIGRADLTGTQGAERRVVELVPRTDRDVVLARLNRPVTNVAPIALATSAPTAGEELTFAGYGRSKTEWAPLTLRTGTYTVDSVATTGATVTGKDGAAACSGDAGGPVVRGTTLVGLSSQSYQGGCYGTDAAQTSTGGAIARVDGLASWVASRTGAPRITDFNGDGIADVAIGDPKATVDGDTEAGVVRIVYGGGKGTAEINQDLDWVAGGSEAGDWFGESLDTVDHNEDGYTDLLVGTPAEDVGTAVDAGFADVLYGAAGGLGTGTQKATHLEQGAGSGGIAASASEAGDRMGHAVAAGQTAAGEPYLVIGVPGEALGTIKKAGSVFYLRGTTNISVHQDKTDVPGTAEENDGYGTSIAADAHHIAVGAPSEKIGTLAGAGGVALFSHTLHADGHPKPLAGLDQDLGTVSGSSEAGDAFGASLALVEFRPSGAASATDSFLVVGSPGEGLAVETGGAERAQAGRVVTFKVTGAGAFTEEDVLWQGPSDDTVSGTAEADDRFGEKVTAVNTAPRAVSSAANLRVAVGVPGEAVGTATKAGAVETFPLLGTAGDSEVWIEAGNAAGLPGTPGAGQYVGRSIHFTGSHLYIGMPYGPSLGAVHALPWANVSGGTKAAVTTYQPGSGGLPPVGARFGYAVR